MCDLRHSCVDRTTGRSFVFMPSFTHICICCNVYIRLNYIIYLVIKWRVMVICVTRVWLDAFMCERTRMTHSYLCCDSCIYACAVTHSFLSALSHIWAFKKSSHTCDLTHSCATGLRVTYLYLCCDSCIYACAVTHSYNWFYWLLSPETAI